MNEYQFSTCLKELLSQSEELDEGVEVSRCRDFQESGVLTRQEGFVCKLSDGSMFQVTIVKVRS